jgi:RNA polymerase sporulation-specific sigma factor
MSIRSAKKHKNEVSINDPIGTDKEGNEISLLEILGSDPEAIADEVELNVEGERLQKLVQKVLSKRERLVIELRYGLIQGEAKTQREIAALLGISRSYVSRIEKKAVLKLADAFTETLVH